LSKVKIIAENAFFLFAGKTIAKFIGVFVLVLIARYLGDEGYGKYTFAFTFISFLSIISELGIAQILVREISRSPKEAGKLIGNAIFVKSVLSFLAFFCAILSIYLFKSSVETVQAIQIYALILLVDIFNIYGVMFEINLKMKYSAFFYILNNLLLLMITVPVIYFNLGLNYIIFATVVADGVKNICIYIISKKFLKIKFDFDFQECKYIVKESLPLAFSAVFTLIYYRIDVIMLSFILGDTAVGIYGAAYRLSETVLFIPEVFMMSMFPLMSKFFENSNEILVFSYEKALKYLSSIAIPMAVGTIILSDRIILTIYGSAFKNSAVALQILILATAIIFINSATSNFYISIKKQRLVMVYTGIGVIINILLNLILIPKFSYVGASIATVLTEISILIINFYYMPPMISRKELIVQNCPSIAASIVMAIFLFVVLTNYSGLWIIIPAAMIYFIFFYLFKGLNFEDREILKKLFMKKT
jgi:O-antigen/teichoic acid export membrane protein